MVLSITVMRTRFFTARSSLSVPLSAVSYEGTDVKSLRKSFEEAVDDYLQTCREQGKEPEHPFKGSFNIRIGSSLHQRIVLEATKKGITLNKYIVDVLEKETAKQKTA